MIIEKTLNKIQQMNQEQLQEKLQSSCKKGDVFLVDFLLFSEQLKEHSIITSEDGIYFKLACIGGNIDLVNYFLHNLRFNHYIPITSLRIGQFNAINYGFMKSCTNGNTNIVDLLLHTPTIFPLLDIHQGFKYACTTGKLDIVKYFLTNKEVFSLIDLSFNDYEVFRDACEYEQVAVINFLLSKGCPVEYVYLYGSPQLQQQVFVY